MKNGLSLQEESEFRDKDKPGRRAYIGYRESDIIPLPVAHVVSKVHRTPLRGWWKSTQELYPRTNCTDFFLVSPYDGYCPIGCRFCYENMPKYDKQASQDLSVVRPYILIKKIQKRLDSLYFSLPVLLSYFGEPFNQLEEEYHRTQQIAYEFLSRGVPIVFMTRRTLPDWAIQYIKSNPDNAVQYSINTYNNDIYKRLSPLASDVQDMLKQAKLLSDLGVYVSIRIDPYIPGITILADVYQMIEAAITAGVKHFVLSFIRVRDPDKKYFFNLLKSIFPGQYEEFAALTNEKYHGYNTVNFQYRKRIIWKLLSAINNRATFSPHSEYWKWANGHIENLAGRWMVGTISDMGKPIPMYARTDLKGPFYRVEECIGTCLKCTNMACGSWEMLDVTNRHPRSLQLVNKQVERALKRGLVKLG